MTLNQTGCWFSWISLGEKNGPTQSAVVVVLYLKQYHVNIYTFTLSDTSVLNSNTQLETNSERSHVTIKSRIRDQCFSGEFWSERGPDLEVCDWEKKAERQWQAAPVFVRLGGVVSSCRSSVSVQFTLHSYSLLYTK